MKQLYRPYLILALLFVSFSFVVKGQTIHSVLPYSIKNGFNFEDIENFSFEPTPISVAKHNNEKEGNPLWAGYSIKANISSTSKGNLVTWQDSTISWLIRIESIGAPALGLVFENVTLPSDGMLFVYSENSSNYFYSISSKDIISGYASTPPILSQSIIIEYTETLNQGASLKGSFDITDVVVIANGLSNIYGKTSMTSSEACHVNINCSPEGNSWQNQKRGIARILLRIGSSWYWCSGSLVNNTNQDGKPYFLTAEHCGGDASESDRSVWQFYFNYEQGECTSTETPPSNIITGCFLHAMGPMDGGSDFQLLELSSTPPLDWQPYYNGWDRKTVGSTSGVSIHHPSGDVKKISTYTSTLTSASPSIGQSQMAANSAWRVIWSSTTNGHGVTEGGSSGAPIFSTDGLIVGSLSGGSSSCSNTASPDYYGKFDYHWASNGTTNQLKLQPWLDPTNSGVQLLQGFDPNGDLYANFMVNKTFALVNEQIAFTDLSTGSDISNWSWNFGASANPASATGQGPHTVYYTSSGPKTISLTINDIETSTKTDYVNIIEIPENAVLYEIFEDDVFPPPGWLNLDEDGDSFKWFSFTVSDAAYSGIKCAASASWLQGLGALSPDNWLITPAIEITHDNYILEYYVSAQDPEWTNETYGVYVSKNGTKPDDFSQIFKETLADAQWHKRQIELADFLGDMIYIAFRHFESNDWYIIKIDDVLVKGGSDVPSDQARIHAFTFDEGVAVRSYISEVLDNQATIVVKVKEDTDFSNLTPIITISQGAAVDYVYPTVIDFTNPVEFAVTSQSGLTTNIYTVTLEYAEKRLVSFYVKDSGENPVVGAIIVIDGVQNQLTTDSYGAATIDLVDGTYSFSIFADDFKIYSDTFTVDESPVTVNVRLVGTNNIILPTDKIEVYPNPFSNSITFNNINKVKRIVITNTLGQVVFNYSSNGIAKETISTYALPRGFYIITFETTLGQRLVNKMIKQ